mgnify:CR=1 FL=1
MPDRLCPRNPIIRLAPDGFLLEERGGATLRVAWASVKEIFAFKVDLFTHDTIRLGFRLSDDDRRWEVDEDCIGYQELVAEIQRRFDIADSEWWEKVAFPAFATNRTTLWSEASGLSEG